MKSAFTVVAVLFLAAALLGWRRGYRKRVKGERLMVRTIGERFDQSWIPQRDVERWFSCN